MQFRKIQYLYIKKNKNPTAKKEFYDFLEKEMTWGEFFNKAKEDKKSSNGFAEVHPRNPFQFSDGELYDNVFYCHIRTLAKTSKFRVFGFCRDGVFHITHIDPKGEIYDKAHR